MENMLFLKIKDGGTKMTKQKYQRVLEFLRDRRSLQSTFEGFTESELREAVEIQNTKGIKVSWCNIMNYLITAHKNYSHDFFVEAVMNATEDILQMPKQEGLAWTKYILELVERMQTKD